MNFLYVYALPNKSTDFSIQVLGFRGVQTRPMKFLNGISDFFKNATILMKIGI